MKTSLVLIIILAFQSIYCQTLENKKTRNNFLFICKLIDNEPNPPLCGIIPFAGAREFEIIKSTDVKLIRSHVIIIIQCPQQYGGDSFWAKNNKYSIKAGLNNDASFAWSIFPSDYLKKKLPVYWAREINLLKE